VLLALQVRARTLLAAQAHHLMTDPAQTRTLSQVNLRNLELGKSSRHCLAAALLSNLKK